MMLIQSSFVFAASSDGSQYNQKMIAELTLKGQELLLERNYPEALQLFTNMQESYPDSPAGFFGEMAVYEVQMLEFGNFRKSKEFWSAAKKGNKVIQKVLKQYEVSKWENMFVASLWGLEGFMKARKQYWFRAYLVGTESRQIFSRIRKTDPSFADADFGVGMYLYWRTVFAKEFIFAGFIPNRKKEGLAFIERVAKEGYLAKTLAEINLAIIYLEEKRYADAEKSAAALTKRYPKNVILRQLYGRTLLAQKKYDVSREQFNMAINEEPRLDKPHYFLAVIDILQFEKDKKNSQLLSRAETNLDMFLKKNSDKLWNSYAYYWKGRRVELGGDKEKAGVEYKKALKLNSKLKHAKFRLRGLGGGL